LYSRYNEMVGGLITRGKDKTILRLSVAMMVATFGLSGVSHGAMNSSPPPLRACADPSNLPFSSAQGHPQGLYLDLANLIAEGLGRTAEPVWHSTYFGKRAVRETLLANECDLFIGLPAGEGFMDKQLTMTKPFAVFGFAIVLPADSKERGVGDLNGERVAVQFGSPPQNLLAMMPKIQSVTVMSPEEGMAALAQGRADAAYLWGPSAGYLNKLSYSERYRVIATEGPELSWPVAIGIRKADLQLREDVSRELEKLVPQLESLERQYGLRSGRAIRAAAGFDPERYTVEQTHPVGSPSSSDAAGSDSTGITVGRRLFNSICAHCHGPNAESPDAHIDLRKLRKRYGDDADNVFSVTVHNGRPDKGMPTWQGLISEDQIASIKTFLDSVQVTN
jgi:polar amino acid transport system substrate-binding protein